MKVKLLALAPCLAPLLFYSDLSEIETALLEAETDLPEIETALPEIDSDMPEIEILSYELNIKSTK